MPTPITACQDKLIAFVASAGAEGMKNKKRKRKEDDYSSSSLANLAISTL
jgi:hypothetical protein